MSSWIAQHSRRLDQELSSLWTEWSNKSVRLWLERGTTLVNQRKANARTRLKPGDLIECTEPVPDMRLFPEPAEHLSLQILWEDEELIAVEKPAGLPCHPLLPWDRDSVVQALLALHPSLRGVGSLRESGLLHRLDNPTSGVLLFAKTQEAWELYRERLQRRSWRKTYWATVEGTLLEPVTLRTPIGHHPKSKKKMQVLSRGESGGQEAITHIEPLVWGDGWTQLGVRIETGVRHQIRVHLSSLGHPIVGDELYGANASSRLFLHAAEVRLPSGEPPREKCISSSVSWEMWNTFLAG